MSGWVNTRGGGIDWDNTAEWGQPGTNVHVSEECGDAHTDEPVQP